VRKEFPSLSITEIGQKLGAKWRAASEDDKKPYKTKAADYQRYKVAMDSTRRSRPSTPRPRRP
jgi:hypothetical protein